MTTLSNKWLKDTLLELLKFAKSTDKRLTDHDLRFAEIDLRFTEIDHKFEKIDSRFAEMDSRFEMINEKFDKFGIKLDKMTNQLDSLVGMHKTTELETVALKSGYKRHERRINKLERHVGIPQSKAV